MSGELQTWFNGLPTFTRYWFGLSVLFPIAGRFGLVPGQWVVLAWEPFFSRFQIWRPLTALFFYKPSFHWLINLYFLYSYSMRLETGIFAGRPADYAFMLFFSWLCSCAAALTLGFGVLMDPMVLAVLYVWCMLNKEVIVSFWFGTQFKAMYLPWVLFGFNLIIQGSGVMELIGILIGHLYFFLMFKYPQDFGGPSLLKTPQIFYDWFPSQPGGVHGFGGTSAAPPRPGGGGGGGDNGGGGGWRGGGHNWGAGNRLGGN